MEAIKFRAAAREVKDMRMLRQCNESDLEIFYRRYEYMIMKIANKVLRLGVRANFEDLVQTGAIGLLTAKERYTLLSSQDKKRVRFTTYAFQCIFGLMLGDNAQLHTVSLEDLDESDQEETPSSVALRPARTVSLEDPVDWHQENPATIANLIPDPHPSPEEILVRMDIWKPVNDLPAKLRLVLLLRYREGYTLEETGKAMGGLTKERIRQIEARALTVLRKRLGTYSSVKKVA